MASLTFQPYVDKENADVFGVQRKGLSGPLQRNGGKTFNSGLNQGAGPPRKALGDVNKDLSSFTKKADLKQQTQSFQKPKGLQIRQPNIGGILPLSTKPGNAQKVNENDIRKRTGAIPKTNFKPLQVKQEVYDEIEKGPPVESPVEDDFEDIWPKADRISTYLHHIIKWRPPCFQIHPDSDSEVEEEFEENKREYKAALERMPEPSTDDAIREEDLLQLELVDFPELLEEIPIPDEPMFLDDSIDIVDNIGTLELKDC